MNMRSQVIFSWLKGHWKFNRNITQFGRVQGEALFSEVTPNELHYAESGTLSLESNAKPSRVQQEYFYTYSPDHDRIDVFFSRENKKENHFHTLHLEKETSPVTASGNHLCINDMYQARYCFFHQDKFKLIYHVKGPKKDYVSETEFERLR